MKGSTHAAVGLALGAAFASYQQLPTLMIVGAAATAAFFALLPDIDHPNATISQPIKRLRGLLFFWASHRGFTHTGLCLALIAALAYALVPSWWAYIAIGYGSHLILDMVTHAGIPLLWPLYRHDLRTPIHIKSGGAFDRLLALVAMLWLALLIYPNLF